jgi:hypothetical protein
MAMQGNNSSATLVPDVTGVTPRARDLSYLMTISEKSCNWFGGAIQWSRAIGFNV